MLEFVCWIVVVSLAVKFLRTLGEKWRVFEWIQINSDNELVCEWARCGFCQSFWIGLAICLILAIFVHWWLIFIPPLSCNLRYE